MSNWSFEPLSANIGATVRGPDLSAQLTDEQAADLYAAWLKYQVLIFEDQTLSYEQFKDFARYFGELDRHSFISKVEGDDDVELLTGRTDAVWTPPTSCYHIDVSMQEVPTKGATLYAVDVPESGGDTIWVSAYAAWEALSPAMQDFLKDKRGYFIAAHKRARDAMIRGGTATHQIATGFLKDPAEHPLVHTHPETGRTALFVDELFMWSIADLAPNESDAIKQMLFEHISRPEFQCRYKWRNGSVAIWDNRCTYHRRVDDTGHKRVMHRLPLKGEGPPAP
jgi:taurine dioxygenase